MFDVELVNQTPFAAQTHVQIDGDGQEILVVVMCATFTGPDGEAPLTLAGTQIAVRFVDEPRGDPACSSIAFESDISPRKPRVDVLVEGHAHAPPGRAVGAVEVALRVAAIDKRLRVTGDRRSSRDPAPSPFERMPMVYERAFGGTTVKGETCRENPVGVGFRGAASADPAVASALPNIEYVDAAAARRTGTTLAAGFGVIARHWSPRIALAGTYDQAWLDTTWPLLPADFDPLFHQTAPLDQQVERIDGGERVELVHMTPSGHWGFRLPRLDVPVHLVHEDRVEACPTCIDTVGIDTDRRTVTLKCRFALRKVRNAPALRAVVLGHATPAWLLARQRLKTWLARPGFRASAEVPCFHA